MAKILKNNRYCVILAGGVGVRLWPKSRKAMPKQFLDLLGNGKSLLRHTFQRVESLVGSENILVLTNAMYKELVVEHLPELSESQILCEPIGRNTSTAIAYAAYYLSKIDPSAQMLVTPSDHYITGEELFRTTVDQCSLFAEQNSVLMTIGIRPTRPESQYGYIQLSSSDSISKVRCFTEKPSVALAETFIQSGEFMWNSGIFFWSVDSIIKAFEAHMPEHHALFSSIVDKMATPLEDEAVNSVFSQCKSISIDYGIMEKADNVYAAVGEFGWSDIGSWSSLVEHSVKDENGNIPSAQSYLYDTHNTLISAPKDKRIVVSGLSDYLVVDCDDVLMICPMSQEHNVRGYIEDIKYHNSEIKGDL